MTDFVTLAHGAGGKQTAELIDRVFKSHFANPNFTGDDAAVLPAPQGRIAMTTDGFIVSPRFFPGGNIGPAHSSLKKAFLWTNWKRSLRRWKRLQRK